MVCESASRKLQSARPRVLFLVVCAKTSRRWWAFRRFWIEIPPKTVIWRGFWPFYSRRLTSSGSFVSAKLDRRGNVPIYVMFKILVHFAPRIMPETSPLVELRGGLDIYRHLCYNEDSIGVPLYPTEIAQAGSSPACIDQISSFGPGLYTRVFSFFVKE